MIKIKGECVCKKCGDEYSLAGLPYERANPIIRDYCIQCIAEMQESHV